MKGERFGGAGVVIFQFFFFFFKNLLDIAQPGFAHQSVFSTGHKWEVQSDTNIVDKIWLASFPKQKLLAFFLGGGGGGQ